MDEELKALLNQIDTRINGLLVDANITNDVKLELQKEREKVNKSIEAHMEQINKIKEQFKRDIMRETSRLLNRANGTH